MGIEDEWKSRKEIAAGVALETIEKATDPSQVPIGMLLYDILEGGTSEEILRFAEIVRDKEVETGKSWLTIEQIQRLSERLPDDFIWKPGK